MKNCPLASYVEQGHFFCNEEDCAWWHDGSSQCAILLIADALSYELQSLSTKVKKENEY